MTRIHRGGWATPASSLAFKTGDWRNERPVHRHRAAPCHAACPAGEDAQAWLARIDAGDAQGAWETLVRVNPLPAITGRVCHHPCESACNRGRFDAPIAIHHVERQLGEQAIAAGWAYPCAPLAADTPRVAVVGAGPAGLSAAWHLRRLGAAVTVFERLAVTGGLLRTAIPPYRLARDVLDAEIDRLLGTGIELATGQQLGRHFSLDELRAQFDGVFVAPGTHHAAEWNVQGATPADLHNGLELLEELLTVGAAPTWRSAAVVGAGNTAIDLARVLKAAGVAEVRVISHKAIPGPGVAPEDAMPAILREIRQALEEGVRIHEHRGVQRLILRGERVVGVEIVHMKKLRGSDGRLHRVGFEGTESVLEVDQVIPAVGQRVDPDGFAAMLNARGYLATADDGRLAGRRRVFAGGDALGVNGTVSAAIGDGRRAAEALWAELQGRAHVAEPALEPIPLEALNLNYYEAGQRPAERVVPVADRGVGVEIELGIDRREAQAEAQRCFSCGECFACDNCWTLCPDSAVLKTAAADAGAGGYVFDYDYCKGCGLCAHECPCGYIQMTPED
ncbi:MAG: FAD-dependent oxidoreductase [Chromatiales bacterium]|nr:FAD-dependent oxidoreductase [Chromatiales bacterium]